MRYSGSESTYILAVFNSGDVVTIDIYDLSDNTKVVDAASCEEVGSTGVFKYLFSQVITEKKEYLWIMSNGDFNRYGKIVLGGWIDSVKNRVESNLDVAVSSRASQISLDEHRNEVEPLIDEPISSRASQSSVDDLTAALNNHDSDIKNILSDIEGTGFDTDVDSLKAIRDTLDLQNTQLVDLSEDLDKHDKKQTAFHLMR